MWLNVIVGIKDRTPLCDRLSFPVGIEIWIVVVWVIARVLGRQGEVIKRIITYRIHKLSVQCITCIINRNDYWIPHSNDIT